MAAPTYQSIATAADAETCAKPSGVASGDLMICFLWSQEQPTITPPSGWTKHTPPSLWVDQNQPTRDWVQEVYTKVAGSSEPSDYTFSADSYEYTTLAIVRVTGQHASSYFNSDAETSEEGNVSSLTGNIDTDVDDCLIFAFASNWSGFLYTWPSELTEVYDAADGFGVAYDPAGAAGNYAYTITQAGTMWAALTLIAIKPAAGGGVSVTPTTLALTLATFAATVLAPRLVTPSTASLTTTKFAPTVSTPRVVTPATATLTLTTFAPTVTVPGVFTPATATLILSTFAPTVSAPRTVTPSTLSLSLTTFAPTVAAPRTMTPPTASLTLTTFAPTVTATSGGPQLVTPDTATLTLTLYAPSVSSGIANVVRLDAGSHTPLVRLGTGSHIATWRLDDGSHVPIYRLGAGSHVPNVRLEAGSHTPNVRGS